MARVPLPIFRVSTGLIPLLPPLFPHSYPTLRLSYSIDLATLQHRPRSGVMVVIISPAISITVVVAIGIVIALVIFKVVFQSRCIVRSIQHLVFTLLHEGNALCPL